MRHTAIDDVHRAYAAFCRVHGARQFGQHATADGAVCHQRIDLARCQLRQQLALLVQHTADVGQHQQLFSLQHGGQLRRHQVGIDVVAFVVLTEADGADDGDELIVLQRLHHRRVDGGDLADLTDVVFHGRVVLVGHAQLACTNQPAVAPGQAHRLAAGGVDQAHDVLLHLAGQHPFDDAHRLFVGDAHALDERALLAQLVQRIFDLRPATVHHDRVHAHQLEQHHVFGKGFLQRRVGHRVATVLDDQRFAVVAADVGQRVRQHFGGVGGGGGLCGVGHGMCGRVLKQGSVRALEAARIGESGLSLHCRKSSRASAPPAPPPPGGLPRHPPDRARLLQALAVPSHPL